MVGGCCGGACFAPARVSGFLIVDLRCSMLSCKDNPFKYSADHRKICPMSVKPRRPQTTLPNVTQGATGPISPHQPFESALQVWTPSPHTWSHPNTAAAARSEFSTRSASGGSVASTTVATTKQPRGNNFIVSSAPARRPPPSWLKRLLLFALRPLFFSTLLLARSCSPFGNLYPSFSDVPSWEKQSWLLKNILLSSLGRNERKSPLLAPAIGQAHHDDEPQALRPLGVAVISYPHMQDIQQCRCPSYGAQAMPFQKSPQHYVLLLRLGMSFFPPYLAVLTIQHWGYSWRGDSVLKRCSRWGTLAAAASSFV